MLESIPASMSALSLMTELKALRKLEGLTGVSFGGGFGTYWPMTGRNSSRGQSLQPWKHHIRRENHKQFQFKGISTFCSIASGTPQTIPNCPVVNVR